MLKLLVVLIVVLVVAGCHRSNTDEALPLAEVLAIEPRDAPHATTAVIDWDAERIDPVAIVIHHTGGMSPMSPEQLSAAGLEHAYATVFEKGNADPFVAAGTKPYSGHYITLGGQPTETFVLYHAYVNQKGERVVYLSDKAIGWHAGNWAVNVESLAIVLEGDFTTGSPSEKMLTAAAVQIAGWCKKYPSLKYLVGHREVRKGDTICPGDWFFSGGAEKLIQLVNDQANRSLGLRRDYPRRVR